MKLHPSFHYDFFKTSNLNIIKLLIIRFSSIGDIVLTTPVIRCLKTQLPDVELHFLTKKAFLPVLEANPYIDELHTFQQNIEEVLLTLRGESFDAIIDLHNNLRSRKVRIALRTKVYTFNKVNFQKWLLTRFKINRLPDVHIVDRYLAATKKFGIQNDGKGLDYFIPKKDVLNMQTYFRKIGLGKSKPYIAFVIGATHTTKRLPIIKIIEIAKKISQPVLLLGGPDDAGPGEFIAKEAGEHVVNLCGKLRLNQSASVVQQAERVITHDTGLMHIAAAFNKKITSIWGNTVPAFGMYPYFPKGENHNTTIEVKGLSCRPCSKIGYDKCPKGHFKCMVDIYL